MKITERRVRDTLIVNRYRAGARQIEIGREFGLNAPRVHDILEKHGLLPLPTPREQELHQSIWERAEGDRLRRAIWKRQREAAQRQLAQMDAER